MINPETSRDGEEESTTGEAFIERLTEGCIAHILSLTSPLDACNSASVSRAFRSAADSDSLWDRFLPSDYQSIVDSASNAPSLSSFASKKQLFYSLSHNPLLIDDSKRSFWLDKRSGKKCYMLGARDLSIAGSDNPSDWTWLHLPESRSFDDYPWCDKPEYWPWINLPQSRFPDVAGLVEVLHLEICGKIDTSKLSPKTCYAAYLVLSWGTDDFGFYYDPVEVSVGIAGGESRKSNVCLARPEQRKGPLTQLECPKDRRDGWLEIELGEYYNNSGEDGELEMSVREVESDMTKGGLAVQGIEIRPKAG